MAAGDVLSGMNRYPSAGWYSTGAYLISGIPYLHSSATGDQDAFTLRFPSISREVTILCRVQSVQVYFKNGALVGTNYFKLSAGQSITLPVRTRQISFKPGHNDAEFSVAATLTGIVMPKNTTGNDTWPGDSFPQWDDVGGVIPP